AIVVITVINTNFLLLNNVNVRKEKIIAMYDARERVYKNGKERKGKRKKRKTRENMKEDGTGIIKDLPLFSLQ
ncbi:unnamed protein product, partial [marine sediment metagenome]